MEEKREEEKGGGKVMDCLRENDQRKRGKKYEEKMGGWTIRGKKGKGGRKNMKEERKGEVADRRESREE